jgi:hypothetical protein
MLLDQQLPQLPSSNPILLIHQLFFMDLDEEPMINFIFIKKYKKKIYEII